MKEQDKNKQTDKQKTVSKIVNDIKRMIDGEEYYEVSHQSVVLDVGETLRGKLLKVEKTVDNKNREIKLGIFETDDGVVDMALPMTLCRDLEQVDYGEKVVIMRIDDGQKKDGQSFKRFRVFVKKE